jgi:hypothetical protein
MFHKSPSAQIEMAIRSLGKTGERVVRSDLGGSHIGLAFDKLCALEFD